MRWESHIRSEQMTLWCNKTKLNLLHIIVFARPWNRRRLYGSMVWRGASSQALFFRRHKSSLELQVCKKSAYFVSQVPISVGRCGFFLFIACSRFAPLRWNPNHLHPCTLRDAIGQNLRGVPNTHERAYKQKFPCRKISTQLRVCRVNALCVRTKD